MPISALPTPPSRAASPSAFADQADALLAALPTFVTEANALQVDVTAKQATVSADYRAAMANGLANAAANAAGAAQAKAQAEYARDQALAGLGVADNSQVLAELIGAIAYAIDVAGSVAADVADPLGRSRGTSREELTALALAHLLDLVGVTARAISGGDVILRAGSAAEPALSPAGNRNTGVLFPAADTVALATAGIERMRVDASGRLGLGTTAPSGLLDVNDNKIRVRTARTPASATASGNAGEVCWDTSYLYVCTATNTWRRVALASW